jgi:hypothetical protein
MFLQCHGTANSNLGTNLAMVKRHFEHAEVNATFFEGQS